MSAAGARRDTIPAFHAKLVTSMDRRLASRLILRAEEAFHASDRIGFDTYSSAACERLGVDAHGMNQPELLKALRRAFLTLTEPGNVRWATATYGRSQR
jgi:hypothetical protein